MDYYQIGQQIRKYRRAQGLSQEQLAEKIGISVTHMSHIETGNTKLSLSVLAALAQALNVRADDLLFDRSENYHTAQLEEISILLSGCSVRRLKVLIDLLKTAKISMGKYFE